MDTTKGLDWKVHEKHGTCIAARRFWLLNDFTPFSVFIVFIFMSYPHFQCSRGMDTDGTVWYFKCRCHFFLRES